MNKILLYIKQIEWEALLWIIALSYLLFINPYEQQIFPLCPFHNIGIDFCPGCGIGRSISFFYHGELLNSLHTHPLGIFAFIVIAVRISILTKKMITNFHNIKRGTSWLQYTN